jgi:zinc protease
MFKGTADHPQGEFSILSRNSAAGERLHQLRLHGLFPADRRSIPTLMAFEADRMRNLVLTDEIVDPSATWCLKSAACAPTATPRRSSTRP